jgi:hypothetical protein
MAQLVRPVDGHDASLSSYSLSLEDDEYAAPQLLAMVTVKSWIAPPSNIGSSGITAATAHT